jgi:hypothetical protein
MDRLTPDSTSHPGISRTEVISDAQFTSARLLTGQWASIGVAIHSQIALKLHRAAGSFPDLAAAPRTCPLEVGRSQLAWYNAIGARQPAHA